MGGFVNLTAELNRDAGNYLHGNFDPESGWFLGANVAGTTATPDHRAVPRRGRSSCLHPGNVTRMVTGMWYMSVRTVITGLLRPIR